jgi:hypothetical protein
MNIQHLISGLKANYPESTHPSANAEKDFVRVLLNMGFTESQLDMLYDELLRVCQFFPKIYDIHTAKGNLGLQSKRQSEVERTKAELEAQEAYDGTAMTFKEWLNDGGMEFIHDQFNGDEQKIHEHLAMLGALDQPVMERKKGYVSELKMLSESLTESNPLEDL